MEITQTVVPTKEQIQELQTEISQLPQTQPITDHFFSGGMYCRRVFRTKDTIVIGKTHKKDHLFICVSGEIVAWTESGMRHLYPGDVVESKAGTKRVTLALTDAIGMTVHITDKTDIDEIEKELVEDAPDSVYLPGNMLKMKEIS